MSQANAQLQAAIHRFAVQPGVTADHAAQLQATINADSDLLAGLNSAAQAGQLKDFAWPAPGSAPSPIGRYDLASGTVTLPASSFHAVGTAAVPIWRRACGCRQCRSSLRMELIRTLPEPSSRSARTC